MNIARYWLAAALALVHAAPAFALSDWSFVSTSGSDSGGCAITSPCRTFQGAYNKTNPGGTIVVLTPGSYGVIAIAHGISIVNDSGGTAAVFAPAPQQYSGAGITITAGANDVVNLRGLTLDGDLVNEALWGITFGSGKSLNVEDCTIRNFRQMGMMLVSSASTSFAVSNTTISNINGQAIAISNTGAGAVQAALNNVRMYDSDGLSVYGTGPTDVTVTDSIAANGYDSFQASSSSATINLTLVRSTAVNNTVLNTAYAGVIASGAGATVRLSQSTVTGNYVGWLAQNGGSVLSYGDNVIDANASGNEAPPSIAKK